MGCLIPLCISFVFSVFIDDGYLIWQRFFWGLDDELYKRWAKRIKKLLYNNGYVFTSDFDHLGVEQDKVNWAIETYFNRHEFEQDLVLSKYLEGEDFFELRFDNLPTRLVLDDNP